ncbi:hypothetical protein FRC00_005419 [Tulasnella sp. 408]|nr:hypothetical protein FRC00_005419 [Tulasnella sp. 408]
MFFLPLRSTLDLMVNRKLHSVCEQYLYRVIWLVAHPYRSLRLLDTLAHRPDLALLVRELQIDLERCHPEAIVKSTIPDILQPDGLAPLSSARNIRSLNIGGLKWLSDPTLAHIRRIVSQMELTSLMISDPYDSPPNDDEEVNQMVISDLRAILQSQPQLTFLRLTSRAVQPALLKSIEAEDVPNLRKFQGTIQYAEAFLNAAPKLTKLDLQIPRGRLAYSLLDERRKGDKIQDLAISLDFYQVSGWDDFGSLLSRFPNTESLYLRAYGLHPRWLLFILDKIVSCLRVLPLLRKLEIRGLDPADSEGPDAMLLKFKKYCPALEIFIDTRDRQWIYIPSAEDGSSFHAKLDCQLEYKWFSHISDLPPPGWYA